MGNEGLTFDEGLTLGEGLIFDEGYFPTGAGAVVGRSPFVRR